MSRSRKKYPLIGCDANVMKSWKHEANKHLRNLPPEIEIGKGSKYRRYVDLAWGSPKDGCWVGYETKHYRK